MHTNNYKCRTLEKIKCSVIITKSPEFISGTIFLTSSSQVQFWSMNKGKVRCFYIYLINIMYTYIFTVIYHIIRYVIVL